MLQFPTNIYPQNVAFDPNITDSNNALNFVFNGDILTTASFKIYIYATGELQSGSFYATDNRVAWHYNGDEVRFASGTLGDGLIAGEDYVIQMMLTQSTVDGADNIYDMPIVRGEIQEDSQSSSSNIIYLKDNINNIYEWQEVGGVCTPTVFKGYTAAGAIIQVGNETRFINSYDRNTGELVIDSAFATLPQKGDSYVIFANYLITPQYYFMCRSTPTLTVSADISSSIVDTSNPIIATASYSQSQQNMIKDYTFRLYWYNRELTDSNASWRFLKSSPKIYSQNVQWWFIKQLIGVDNIDGVISDLNDVWYKIECEVTTQEGMSITSNTIFSLQANTDENAFVIQSFGAEIVDEHMPDYIPYVDNLKHQTVRVSVNYSLRPDYNEFSVTVYRRDLETNTVVFLGTAQPKVIQGSIHMVYYDYLVPNKGSFEYIYVPRDRDGCPYINAISKTTINTNMVGYTLTALITARGANHELGGYKHYSIGQCWKFVGEIEDSTITQNINRSMHVGLGNYSSVSSTDVNYASGSLSAMIGTVDCLDKKYKDTIDMVNAWRQFITQNSVFLLKSQKGDVWVVNITDSPSVTYDESYKDVPTTFSFSWAECCSVDDIQTVQ